MLPVRERYTESVHGPVTATVLAAQTVTVTSNVDAVDDKE
jgi:hypothetical protein